MFPAQNNGRPVIGKGSDKVADTLNTKMEIVTLHRHHGSKSIEKQYGEERTLLYKVT